MSDTNQRGTEVSRWFVYTGMKTFTILAMLGGLLAAPAALAQTGTACTMQYAPVCGARQVQCVTAPCYPVYETFGNACVLNASGATFVHEGECTADETGPVVPEPTYVPPQGCTAWFDGCNQCGREPGGAAYCTERACVGTPAPGYCTSYETKAPASGTPDEPVAGAPEPAVPAPAPEPEAKPGFLARVWHALLTLLNWN